MSKPYQVFCFGEVLWDEVNQEDLPGGAPLNVAYHLAKDSDFDVHIISSLGADPDADKMLTLLKDWSINTKFLQLNNTYPTGRVRANTSDKNNVVYEILQPVAWDYIEKNDQLIQLLNKEACLVFGSLACRNEKSRSTLFELLKIGCFRVFDINLRGSFYNGETLTKLLSYTDLLKINEEELLELMRIFRSDLLHATELDQIRFLMMYFEIQGAIITKGADGSSFYSMTEHIEISGKKVEVVDTIGCGDAFLSGFLRFRLKGTVLKDSLERAALMGAFVAQMKGGCPPYTLQDYDKFLNN